MVRPGPGPAHPPSEAHPPASEASSHVIVGTQLPAQTLLLGDSSNRITCPYCVADVNTVVTYVPTLRTHVFATILILVGCCCVPYFCNCCKTAEHKCPRCQRLLGRSAG